MPGRSIPTPNESLVLRLLWRQGPLTVRQIRDQLLAQKPLAYTTVLTIVNVLLRKGWLTRRRVGKADLYAPALDEPAGRLVALRELADRLFDADLDRLARFLAAAKGMTIELPGPDPATKPALTSVSPVIKPPAERREKIEKKEPGVPFPAHLDVDLL